MFYKKVFAILSEASYSCSKILATLVFLYNVKLNSPLYFQDYVFTMGAVAFLSPFVSYYATFKSANIRIYRSVIDQQIKVACFLFSIFIIVFPYRTIYFVLIVSLLSCAIRSEQLLIISNKKYKFNLFAIPIYCIGALYYFISSSENYFALVFSQISVDAVGFGIACKVAPKAKRRLKLGIKYKVALFNLLSGVPSVALSYCASLSYQSSIYYTLFDKLRSLIILSAEIVSNVSKNISLGNVFMGAIGIFFLFSIAIYLRIYNLADTSEVYYLLLAALSFGFYCAFYNQIRFGSNINVLFLYQILHLCYFVFIAVLMTLNNTWIYLLLAQPMASCLIFVGSRYVIDNGKFNYGAS